MKLDKKSMTLYAVTDRSYLGEYTLYEKIEEALKAGITFLQLREKELNHDEFLKEAKEIKELTDRYNTPFVINDNIEIAIECNADGVHIGQDDLEAGRAREKIGKDKIIGVSVQTVEQAILAEKRGADYLGVGAVFTTSTKLDADSVSHDTLKAICEAVNIPVVAIGGINENNILELSKTGIDGVAVVSAIFAKENVLSSTKELLKLLEKMINVNKIKKILTIAGSDCSGGAGIQADIKTITAHKMYAMSAITALTAQNTTGVYGIEEASPEFVGAQLDCIFNDIRPDAVKIGMVSNSKIIEVIANKLNEYKAENIVVDPVMVATSGSNLLCNDATEAMVNKLLPLGTVITPNIPEAEAICGFQIKTEEDMIKAAKEISKVVSGGVLIKGGHLTESANDILYDNEKVYWFKSERINNENTHGTGCTLSSAIACNLADGSSLERSILNAKQYITGALKAGLNLGKGNGPLEHTYCIK